MKVARDTFTSLPISHLEGPGNWRCLPNPRPDWYQIRGNHCTILTILFLLLLFGPNC